ncbi:MAG: ABC transporter ATP-binding protein [Bacteroidota bacterium]
MSEIQPLLQVKNLITVFQTKREVIKAVNDVSFYLNKKEILGVVGESGSGKSATALSIMQLLKPAEGRVESGKIIFTDNNKNTDLILLTEKEKQKFRGKDIAMIFQGPASSLNPVMNCGNQVVEILRVCYGLNSKDAHNRTLELFKKVKLHEPEIVFNAYPHQLSGGQKQRVMIAIAISCNPSVLIADEPTTSLDVTAQASIIKLLKHLQQENGMSIIFITHDLGVVYGFADRLLVMHRGKIVEEGITKEVFHHPVHPYTKGLLACRPALHMNLYKLPVISDFMETDASGRLIEKLISVDEIRNSLNKNDAAEKIRSNNIYKEKPFISVTDISVHFPVRHTALRRNKDVIKAVSNVSFNIYKGETLGLVGESGCGKSTLGKALLNLVRTANGDVQYLDRNLTALSVDEMRPLRKNLQLIFQDPYSSLNPRLTAGDAIVEPMKEFSLYSNDNSRKEFAMHLLKKVGMDETHFKRYPHEFSGGQRQRIGIARTLALNPEFIICDECVSSLDVSVQAQVLNLLNDLKVEFGFTYLFISHDLSVVKFMSDRVMIMHQGQIVETGSTDELYANPKSEHTQKLIDAIPKLD